METTIDYMDACDAERRRRESWRRYAEAQERRRRNEDDLRAADAYEKCSVMGHSSTCRHSR